MKNSKDYIKGYNAGVMDADRYMREELQTSTGDMVDSLIFDPEVETIHSAATQRMWCCACIDTGFATYYTSNCQCHCHNKPDL